jgi:hypothetical protein
MIKQKPFGKKKIKKKKKKSRKRCCLPLKRARKRWKREATRAKSQTAIPARSDLQDEQKEVPFPWLFCLTLTQT